MGEFTNGRWSNMLGVIALLLMTVSAALLIYFQFKINFSSFSFLCKNLLPYKLILPTAID
jgi:hypothetical protein